jgi:tetratricopeptide (TPR) repeat protein
MVHATRSGGLVQEEIKRDEAGRILKKLQECRIHLRNDNVYSCLTGFRDVLEKTRSTGMLPADEKQLHKDINIFQNDLASSRAFRHLYGPVTFKDDDIGTTLDFMKQLIQIKEEEIAEAMENQLAGGTSSSKDQDDLQQRIQAIMRLVEQGDFSTARQMAEKDEEAADALIELYNTSGIEYRKEKDFEKAITTFKKSLFIRPEDEGLYYNLARVYIETGDWVSAKDAMEEALKANPDFQEGKRLLSFICQHLP